MGTYVTIGSQLRFACHATEMYHSRSTDLSKNLSDHCQPRKLQIGKVTHDGHRAHVLAIYTRRPAGS